MNEDRELVVDEVGPEEVGDAEIAAAAVEVHEADLVEDVREMVRRINVFSAVGLSRRIHRHEMQEIASLLERVLDEIAPL